MARIQNPTPEMIEMLRRTVSPHPEVARAAYREMARALTLPLQKGVMNGDIVGDIFEQVPFAPGVAAEFPLDFVAPGTEGQHVAYTLPGAGRIPERHVEGDYLMVPTFEIGSSIDMLKKYARDARWDVVGRAMEVLEASFIRKMNTDGFRTLIYAGVGRNLMVYDSGATAGVFSKRLVSLMKTVMRRYAGGNSSSVDRGQLTRLYISPEAIEDIRSWDADDLDDLTRREVFISEEKGLTRLFGVDLRDIDELGVGQEFNTYFDDTLGENFTNSKVELVVGLDLSKNDSFVMPVREPVTIVEDPTFARQRRLSWYGTAEHGFACLGSRRVLLGEF